MNFPKAAFLATILLAVANAAFADAISVNFHVENDANAQADHELTGSETAGLGGNTTWNNINVGYAGTNSTGAAFATTTLKDDAGNSSAATISTSGTGTNTWFVGYAASAASTGAELGLAGDDDNLFNSYLGINTGDNQTLTISGLGAAFTSGGYKVIVYSDTDRRGTSNSARTSTFTLTPGGGSVIVRLTEDDDVSGSTYNVFNNAYFESDGNSAGTHYSNYTVFTGLTAGSFTLAIDSPDGGRGGISGFQIVTSDTVPLPAISLFKADDLYVPGSTTVNLSWETSGATSLQLSGVGDVTGQTSAEVNPTATTTYTLTASNAAGSVEADVRVVVGPERPNILLVLVDDYGPMDTSVPFAYNHYDDTGTPLVTAFSTFYHTPNMEVLAAQGMKFTQAYAQPVCSPTRTSLMTGYNSPRHGIGVHLNVARTIDNNSFAVKTERGPNNWRFKGMETTDVTLPKLLGAAGYRTIHCGKAHFGSDVIGTGDPRGIGFDINIAGSERGQPGSYTGNYGNDLPGMDEYENTGTFLTDALTKAMNKNIEQSVADGVPFFGYMSYYAVHTPLTTNPDATHSYSGAASANHTKFATMVEGVDISLGDIVAKLTELGVAENTLIFFMGDNGSDSPALTDEGYSAAAFRDYPIRGKKASAYEGGSRIPLIVSWAANNTENVFQQSLPITGGSVEHDMVGVEDIMPSILSAANVTPPDMDGYDLSPYLRSESGTHRPQKILRFMPHEHRSNYFLWFRDADWKIIYRFHTEAFELYNLADDPDESDNLAAAQPQKLLAMARAMARELDGAWGIYGPLWPTHNPTQVEKPARPLVDDPFFIDYTVDGRAAIDSDGDGLNDVFEDADADGLASAGETDPDNGNSDGDNINDGTELSLGLDPLDPGSYFYLHATAETGGALTLTWPSSPGTNFAIRGSVDLGDWSEVVVPDVSAADPGTSTSHEIPPSAEPRKFFRIELK